MILLRLLSWPYARKHALRSALTVAGVALGVAVWTAVHTANESVLYALEQTVDRIAGTTQLEVTAGRAGFEEEVLERVQSLPEVRVATPVIEAVVDTGLPGQGSLLLLGVDLTGDASLRRYEVEGGDEDVVDDPLEFLAQPDSLILTREFAARNGLAISSRLPMRTMDGQKQFTVRGLLRPGGLARAFGGNLAIMDLYAAQLVLGRGRTFDRIDLAVRDGVSVNQVRLALQKMLGPGFQVQEPAARGRQFESLLRVYSITANICSLFGVLIGTFLIYSSFAIAVTERRAEIGILRALGATRRQIRLLFLGESAASGLAGGALGTALGVAAASAIAGYVGTVFEAMYGLAQRVEQVSLSPALLASGLAMGVLASMAAALVPAHSAAGVDPVEALQKGKHQVLSADENRRRRVAAAALAAVSLICLFFGRSTFLFYAGYLSSMLAAILLAPTLCTALARLLRPVLKRLRPVEGALAADSLLQAPRRTSATVAAIMISLALAVGMGGIAGATHRSILEWLDNTVDSDLLITPSENRSRAAFRFPPSLGPQLEGIEGVAQVQPVRTAQVPVGGRTALLMAVDVAKLSSRARLRRVDPQQLDMYAVVAAGKGLIVSENFAELEQVHLGDPIEIATPRGPLRLPVVGSYRDFTSQQGTIVIDRALFRSYWNDDTVSVFRVYLRPGAAPGEVKRRILEALAGERRLFVLTNADVRDYVRKLAGQWFRVTYVQIAVAVLVAVLGIANTLIVSITDRRRELGVLQAVGGLPGQVRCAVWMEAMTIGLIGLILGLALGAVNLYYSLEMVRRDIAGMRLDYRFPVETALWMAPVVVAAALVAALGPAERAVRASLVEALEYE